MDSGPVSTSTFILMMTMQNQENVLFVDDEESILELAVNYFEQKGYSVHTAANGVEAIDILETETIDCCFTDINMPEMDGLMLAEHIHKLDNTLPVIVMTGYPSLENTLKTLKNGVVDFLIKPINLNQMEICVRRVLNERKLFVENMLLKKEMESKARLEKLNQELVYKLEDLHILNKIMSDISTISRSSDIFRRLVEMSIELTPSDESKFYVINEVQGQPFEVAEALSNQYKMDSGYCLKKGSAQKEEGAEPLILEIVRDEIPLLMTENNGARGLPSENLSFMIVPLKIQEKVFGVLTASVKIGDKRFTDKELYYLSFMTQKVASTIENLALYEHINQGLMTTLRALVKAIEARDPYTKQHSNRVTEIAVLMGKAVGCSDEEIDILNISGPLHDIGKIGIRDDILLKPGRLTHEEFEKIKEHPDIGADIIGQLGMWDEHQKIIRHHHERFDGNGYPAGLRGDEIPFLARIVTVADAYDAMASDRAYRKKMGKDRILKIIRECSGSQFDPQLVDVFNRLFQAGHI